MKTLYILRHAASGHSSGTEDRDRPLNEEGGREALAIAAKMQAENLKPGIVLCSAALRTKQTARPIGENWDDLEISYEDNLYLATTGELYERIRAVEDDYGSALLIGHNPGLHGLAVALAGSGDPELMQRILPGFEAGCFVTIKFDCESWDDILPGGGTLETLFTGKELT